MPWLPNLSPEVPFWSFEELKCGISEEIVHRLSMIWHGYTDSQSFLFDRLDMRSQTFLGTRLAILIIPTDREASSLRGFLA
jgi:hypothetical protein